MNNPLTQDDLFWRALKDGQPQLLDDRGVAWRVEARARSVALHTEMVDFLIDSAGDGNKDSVNRVTGDLAGPERLVRETHHDLVASAEVHLTFGQRSAALEAALPFPDPLAAGLDMTTAAGVTVYSLRKTRAREPARRAARKAKSGLSDGDRALWQLALGAAFLAAVAPDSSGNEARPDSKVLERYVCPSDRILIAEQCYPILPSAGCEAWDHACNAAIPARRVP